MAGRRAGTRGHVPYGGQGGARTARRQPVPPRVLPRPETGEREQPAVRSAPVAVGRIAAVPATGPGLVVAWAPSQAGGAVARTRGNRRALRRGILGRLLRLLLARIPPCSPLLPRRCSAWPFWPVAPKRSASSRPCRRRLTGSAAVRCSACRRRS